MNDLLQDSVYFGFAITLFAYWIGMVLAKKINFPLLNPMVIAIILVVIFLLLFDIEVETYNKGADFLQHFLTPATVCLAVPLYRKLQVLKDNLLAILAGVFSGCVASGVGILALCKLTGLDQVLYRSLLPKSITTAMALGVAEKLQAMPSITIIGIMVAGLTGAIMAPIMFRIFRIVEPVAQGLSIGTCSHALGTTKAVEIGEVQGAMSGLAIVVAGVVTVVLAPIMAQMW
ncbi:MAG: LrgB family protein [Lachnospiraceae bacterium]|jgi:predicted murein hydrolase (TIGR00659 family)|nr:LrgB family protein [Lachnospiraceae bacterium]